ncbi:hypothetical protein B0H16DRAFT_1227641, partial [Mycena metata]
GIVSGSTALLMITDLDFQPGDIDIYVPESQEDTAIALALKNHSFSLTKSMKPPYENNTAIKTVHWLKKDEKKMNIMVVKGENAVLAIFQFHSTVVMNFLSSTGVYCAYPSLTLSNRALPNLPIMLREIAAEGRCRDCYDKYRNRGITFEIDPRNFDPQLEHHCYRDSNCPMTFRTTRDTRGQYVELFPRSQLESEMEWQHKYMVIWSLGGPICGKP